MPTFKHPCPYCEKFIDRAVAACPFCGQVDPFSPKRCTVCRRIIEDPAWVVCPGCGQSLIAPASGAPGTTGATNAPPPAAAPSAPAPARTAPASPVASAPAAPAQPSGVCSGCGAPLPSGARFCTICGTVAG
jgi:RNA polymerase subunit RPABC4/transcription elongation factor Spt4